MVRNSILIIMGIKIIFLQSAEGATNMNNQEEYKALREELIEHYRKELAYIYTHHDRPPVEYYEPIQTLIPQLILHLDGRELREVLSDCWKIAWIREPVCHPNVRYREV